MNVLIFEQGTSYTIQDIKQYFGTRGIHYKVVSYFFKDTAEDDYFCFHFLKYLSENRYDFVYSTNFFPLVAKCCHERGIKYISWSYDNPLGIFGAEEQMGCPENFIFMFDKIQVEKYRNMGFDNVYYMPLAVNTERLDAIKINGEDSRLYSSEISFVGKLYPSQLSMITDCMDEYNRGYIDGIVKAQSQIYGYYMVDELISDRFIENVNDHIKKISGGTAINVSKEALSYAIGTQITRNERLMLLKLLSNHFQVKLYSNERNEYLDKVDFRGTVNYKSAMIKVFKLSLINLNINLRVSQSGIPLRVIDILGSGGFLLSSYQPEIDEYFGNGIGAVLYDSMEDAYDKAEYYIHHDKERKAIAERGHEIAKNNFSYDNQFRKIFEISGIL